MRVAVAIGEFALDDERSIGVDTDDRSNVQRSHRFVGDAHPGRGVVGVRRAGDLEGVVHDGSVDVEP